MKKQSIRRCEIVSHLKKDGQTVFDMDKMLEILKKEKILDIVHM